MPAGRPTKLTPDVQTAICLSLSAGNYLEPSAIRAGVSKVSVYAWLKRAGTELERLRNNGRARLRKSEQPYVEFLEAVKGAEAAAEIRDVATVALAAQDHWQAAAWRLERKHFDRWGRKQALEHTGKDGKAIKVKGKTGLTKDMADAIRKRVLGIDASTEPVDPTGE